MMYERVAAAFYGTPWAMERGKFDVIRSVLARKQAGERFSEIEIKAASAERRSGRGHVGAGRDGRAVLSSELSRKECLLWRNRPGAVRAKSCRATWTGRPPTRAYR